jgi:hypothetical protein
MINSRLRIAALVAAFMAMWTVAAGQQDSEQSVLRQLASGTTFSGQWFMIYQISESGGDYSNQFLLRRGYITFNKRFNEYFSVRFTQDIITDEEGSDAGNIEMRLKYCLLHIDNTFMPVLKSSWWEMGLINRPWFGFEDKVNDYRVQGAMYLDKYKVLSSADFGVSFSGLIGGEVDSDYQKNVSSSFPGRYGSYSIGVYNGGGYHAIEANSNKTVEGRLTLRPLGDILPGLQVSYNILTGKGNTQAAPDFNYHHLYLSWQSRHLIFAGQVYRGRGNGGGVWISDEGVSYINRGYSVFGEARLLPTKWALMTRYDRYNLESDTPVESSSVVAGLCYRFAGGNKILVNTDIQKRNNVEARLYEVALEIKF